MGIIYIITCDANNKVYIGQTRDSLKKRMSKHVSSARTYQRRIVDPTKYQCWRGTCSKLYAAMNKYGIEKFRIDTLEEVDDAFLNILEAEYIKKYKSVECGYNLREGGDASPHCEETKQKISVATKAGVEANIANHKKYTCVKDMPMYCIRVCIKGSEGVAINNHPLCKRKSFTVRKYGSIDAAKAAAIAFLEQLERGSATYNSKRRSDLPRGLRQIKGGYAVQKIIGGKLHYKAFTKCENDEDNLENARRHLMELITKKLI
jgi:group I intron endonuclease